MNPVMPTTFDFWYAVNNTEVLVMPSRHIETFGNTIIEYTLVSKLMDSVDQVRVREGRMQAMRPQIVTPSAFSNMVLEGFGEQAQKYADWLRDHEDTIRILRYGYNLKQTAFSEEVVTDSLEAVLERVMQSAAEKANPFQAVVKGVDNPWDVCLVKLFWQVIQSSAKDNIRELNERKLFDIRDGLSATVREEIEKAFQAAAHDPSLVKSLGALLQKHGVFESYQDRFFQLVRRT
jgi:hypothetical protein